MMRRKENKQIYMILILLLSFFTFNPKIIHGKPIKKANINKKNNTNIQRQSKSIHHIKKKKLTKPININKKNNPNPHINNNKTNVKTTVSPAIVKPIINPVRKIITENNKKVSKENTDNQDILNLYLPLLEEQGISEQPNNNVSKVYSSILEDENNKNIDNTREEDIKRERVIREYNGEVDKEKYESKQSLPKTSFNEKTINTNQNAKKDTKSPVKKGSSVARVKRSCIYSSGAANIYQPILEEGRVTKRAFTIHENINLTDFLLSNFVVENQVQSLTDFLKNEADLNQLITGQYVVLILKKKYTFFKKHKLHNFENYTLNKLVIFYDDGCLILKLKGSYLIQKKIMHNKVYNNFFTISCSKLQDFQNLFTIQNNCSVQEYSFLLESLKFLMGIFEKKKIEITRIDIIFHERKSNRIVGKIYKTPVAIFIYTDSQRYCCYLYKDFADNFHLLNAQGNSINVELLDVSKNPPITGLVTSLFGHRRHPILKYHKFHGGLDIYAPINSLIFSTLNGWVLFSGKHETYGNALIICYGNTICTLYGHLNTLFVTAGDYIEAGRVIGAVGSTGRSSGPHVHYEIFKSTIKQYTIPPEKLGGILKDRVLLDPGLRYKISLSLRLPEIPYFYSLVNSINQNYK